jgi:hypothetical protein
MMKDFFETVATTEQDFVKLAMSFGKPMKSRRTSSLIETLVSRPADQVEKDSLSRRYGLGKFPIHTDCAYLNIPPKYIVLRYIGEYANPTPTSLVLFDLARLTIEELEFISRIIWYVKSPGKGFYSTILQRDIIRYDAEVMKMVNSGENRMNGILAKMETSEIQWTRNKTLVVNNHKILHFRSNVSDAESNRRIIQRINIQ